jgi:hypothetical protein
MMAAFTVASRDGIVSPQDLCRLPRSISHSRALKIIVTTAVIRPP